MTLRALLLGLSSVAVFATPAIANDAAYPTKTVRLIVPFVPGGAIGAEIVAKASPDGHPGAENAGWFGIAVPAKVSPAVAQAIHAETTRIVAQPAFRERLATFGMAPVGQSIDEFRASIRSESVSWGRIVAERRITIQ